MSNQFRLLLFIVVISGALCTVEDYVIMSQCAHNKAIHVAAEGTVSVTDISQTQNITIVGLPDYVNNDFKIALYAKETQRYVCFNENWKLVGMKELRDSCYFNETIVHGYFVFRSVVDLQRRVGFTHRGKAIGPKKNVNDACYLFTKIQADQFFHQHTNLFALKPKTTATSPTSTATLSSTSSSFTSSSSSSSSPSSRLSLTTATNRSKLSRNKNKRVNGMRNNSNNNQNQQYTHGHSSNISASNSNHSNNSSSHNNNNTNLSNTRQQLGLSQSKNHNNSGHHTREHVRQQHHQVRHHHNDPNVIARRQQHEHKQKRRQRNRVRGATSLTTTTTTTAKQQKSTAYSPFAAQVSTQPSAAKLKTKAAATTSQSKAYTTTQTAFSATASASASASAAATATNRYKQQHAATATNVATTPTAAAAAAAKVKSLTTTTTTTNKRKGRRRKGKKQHRNMLQKAERQQMLPLKAHNSIPTATKETFDAVSAQTPTAYNSASAATTTIFDDFAGSSSGAGDYAYGSNEWLSSLEPFESSPATPTASASEAFSSYSPSSAVETSSSAMSTAVATSDYNNTSMELTDGDFSAEADVNTTNVAATYDSNILPTLATDTSTATTHANSIIAKQHAQQQLYSTSATYSLPDTWSPATFYDELETTVHGVPLLAPTATFAQDVANGNAIDSAAPTTYETKVNLQLNVADEFATTTSNDNETDSSSNNTNSEFSAESTEPMEDVADGTTLTAATTTIASSESASVADIMENIFKRINENIFADASENMISVNNNTKPAIKATPETFWHNMLLTSQQPHNEYSSNKKTTATTTPTSNTITDSSTIRPAVTSSASNISAINMTEFIYSTRSSHFHTNSRHRNVSDNNNSNNSNAAADQQRTEQQRQIASNTSNNFSKKYLGEGSGGSLVNAKLNWHVNKLHSNKSPATTLSTTTTTTAAQYLHNTTATTTATTSAASTTTMTNNTVAEAAQLYPSETHVASKSNINNSNLLSVNKNINHSQHNNTISESNFDSNSNEPQLSTPAIASTATATTATTATTAKAAAATTATTTTTKKSIRISTQKLLATPFHQLTYVRNDAGDIDIDNIDNISVYPDLLEEQALAEAVADTNHADVGSRVHHGGNSRLTVVSGYLPTSATAVLPESIRIAKIKINKERKRMMTLRQRHFGSYT